MWTTVFKYFWENGGGNTAQRWIDRTGLWPMNLSHQWWYIIGFSTYLNANQFILIWVKMNVAGVAGNCRLMYKLHLDVSIDSANVLVHFVAIQYKSKIDVSTRISIWSPVYSDSWTFWVDDHSSYILPSFVQLSREIHNWHSTQQSGTVCVSWRQLAWLQNITIQQLYRAT